MESTPFEYFIMTLIVLNTILLMLKVNPALSTTSKVANNMNLQWGFDRELSSYFGTNCKGRGIVQSLNIIQGRRMKQKLWSVSSSPLNPNDQRSLFPPSPPIHLHVTLPPTQNQACHLSFRETVCVFFADSNKFKEFLVKESNQTIFGAICMFSADIQRENSK